MLEPSLNRLNGKSAGNSAPGVRFRTGHDPRRGHGPEKGAPNAGRPPDAWRAECRAVLTRADALAKAEAVIGNPDHPAWLGALKFVVEQAYGKPKPESETGPRILRVVYENALPNLHDEESSRLGPPETQAT